MAVFGVHMWLPTAHAEHPTSFAPFIVTIVGVGNYVVVRLLVQGMPDVFAPFAFPLMVVAVLTMVYGGALTMIQTDVKYLLRVVDHQPERILAAGDREPSASSGSRAGSSTSSTTSWGRPYSSASLAY